jgi:hypothetical protein
MDITLSLIELLKPRGHTFHTFEDFEYARLLKEQYCKIRLLGGTPNFRKFFKNFLKIFQKNTKFSIIRGGSPPVPPGRDTPVYWMIILNFFNIRTNRKKIMRYINR